jgi:Tfp pilus assembly protein PilF
VTAEDREVVTAYVENAAAYYDGGHFLRAYSQWDRALAIDPHEDRARLGQAMALYQLGREDTKDGIARLTEAEKRLEELRDGELGDQSWKAELGYALVQLRWAEAFGRVVTIQSANQAAGRPHDAEKLDEARREIPRRAAMADTAFRNVLSSPNVEPNLKLTTWIGLARVTSMRGAYEESLEWARKYEAQVVQSAEFWRKQGDEYASKLFGAELQEAELRDVLANTLFKLGRFDESEKELDRLIGLQPERASAYLNRGVLREARSAWDLARSDFARFLSTTTLPSDDPAVLEAEKRRILCEERLESENERLQRSLPPAR